MILVWAILLLATLFLTSAIIQGPVIERGERLSWGGIAILIALAIAWYAFLSVAPAKAQYGAVHLPPVEYDVPYRGQLTVETVTLEELLERCRVANRWSLGCATQSGPNRERCHIMLVDDATMKAAGWTRALMLRHELAHCNGWPAHHPGMRWQ